MDVKGMTAGELANMTLEQFDRLNLRQAQDALTILNKAVNKSIKRAEDAGKVATQAPAYKALMEGGGKIRTRGYSGSSGLNLAKAEIKRASDYLNMSTRTVRGAKAHHRQAAKYFGLPKTSTPEQVSEISKQIDSIMEEFPAEFANIIGQSYQMITKQISERLQKGNTPEEISDALQSQYERIKSGEIDMTQNYEKQLWTSFTNQLDDQLQQI